MITGNTRATSKCLRIPLGFVMSMAGYEVTPLEEIDNGGNQSQPRADEPFFDPAKMLRADAPKTRAGWKGVSKLLNDVDPSIEWSFVLEQAVKGLFGANFELKTAPQEQKDEAFYRAANAAGRLSELFINETFLSLESIQKAFAEMFSGIVVTVKEFEEKTAVLDESTAKEGEEDGS